MSCCRTLREWVKDAWCTIQSAMVNKAFIKCAILNAMDGKKHEMVWAVESDKEVSFPTVTMSDDYFAGQVEKGGWGHGTAYFIVTLQ